VQTDRAASLTTSERKRRNDDERLAYLARVAAMYFEESRTQQEIAQALGISRSGVSRLLTEARERGVVEIVIHHPLPRARELERALAARFGLKEARVLAGGDDGYEAMLRRLGRLAARYFEDRVHDGMTIGISWGGALYEMIREIRPRDYTNVEVVQLIGATGAEATPTSGPILAQQVAGLQHPCQVPGHGFRGVQDGHLRPQETANVGQHEGVMGAPQHHCVHTGLLHGGEDAFQQGLGGGSVHIAGFNAFHQPDAGVLQEALPLPKTFLQAQITFAAQGHAGGQHPDDALLGCLGCTPL